MTIHCYLSKFLIMDPGCLSSLISYHMLFCSLQECLSHTKLHTKISNAFYFLWAFANAIPSAWDILPLSQPNSSASFMSSNVIRSLWGLLWRPDCWVLPKPMTLLYLAQALLALFCNCLFTCQTPSVNWEFCDLRGPRLSNPCCRISIMQGT